MEKRFRRGFSLIELLIVVAIILIIAGITIPYASAQMMHAREMAAIREVRTIQQAEIQYYSQFGQYAKSLAELGPSSGNLIPASLASGKKSGHVYAVAPTPTGYAITVTPDPFGVSGRRHFFSDETLVIRESRTAEPATRQSPELATAAAPEK